MTEPYDQVAYQTCTKRFVKYSDLTLKMAFLAMMREIQRREETLGKLHIHDVGTGSYATLVEARQVNGGRIGINIRKISNEE